MTVLEAANLKPGDRIKSNKDLIYTIKERIGCDIHMIEGHSICTTDSTQWLRYRKISITPLPPRTRLSLIE